MPFISENKLEEALVRAVKSPATAPDFYRLLLESELLVLGTVEGQEEAGGAFSLDPGGQLQLVTGDNKDGKFLPVFSSLARMQEYVKEEAKYLSINGRALLDLTRGAPVILNPASEYGREFTPGQVEQLLNPTGPSANVMPGASDAFYPIPLINALTSVFEKHPEVQAAWMIRIGIGDAGAQVQPLVGIETSGDMAALVADVERAAAEGAAGIAFDVQRVDRARPTGLASALLQAQPFYQRGAAVPGRLLN
ncbi:MAG: enhanced serine sensitivity protein SseB C-terminal domain-containing protein [Pseudomonadota bacterium]